MDFNTIIDRRGTHCAKWDMAEAATGIAPEDGLPMWVADSDYPTAPCVIEAARAAVEHGIFGYTHDATGYPQAIRWWMATRHGWEIDPDWIVTTNGLGHGIATVIDVLSEPGEGVAYFTPVYHEFHNKTQKSGRRPVPLPMVLRDGRYHLDFDDAARRLPPDTRILLWCSPQNPSGRVWTPSELRAVADFAADHELILVSDEVHHDLVYPGHHFVPMDVAVPGVRPRLIVATAASKTFNIAGLRTGQLTIPDPGLRARVAGRLRALDYAPNMMGVAMTRAAYSTAGAEWADAQIAHLDANRRIFDAGIAAIPGITSMPLQSTYLAWVDFTSTGMSQDEIDRRIRDSARIGVSPGPGFGPGGELHHRFNLAAPRARIEQAVARLQTAFADLQ